MWWPLQVIWGNTGLVTPKCQWREMSGAPVCPTSWSVAATRPTGRTPFWDKRSDTTLDDMLKVIEEQVPALQALANSTATREGLLFSRFCARRVVNVAMQSCKLEGNIAQDEGVGVTTHLCP